MNKTMIMLTVSLAMFMESVDTTVINTAIPNISYDLNINPIDLKIALISYLLSLAIFIPISGWIADKFGIKKIFMSGLSIFIISSFFCGLSHHLDTLVIARILQGLGGSLLVPVGRLILIRTFGKHDLIKVMSQVVTLASLGIMLGPVIGGIITHYISWRWIFWINIPIGLASFFIALYYLENMLPQAVMPLDKLGFILFGTGLALLTFSLSAFSETSTHSVHALIILASALFLFILYLAHSRKKSHPFINPALFHARTFKISVISNLIARLGFGGVPFLLPLMLQITLGYSAPEAGMMLVPMALGILLSKQITFPLLKFFGYKRLLIFNTSCVSLLLFTFANIYHNTSIYIICSMTFLFGFLMSLQYSCMTSIAYSEITSENYSAATSVISTLQQLSQSFGVATCALLIRYFSNFDISFNLTLQVFHATFFSIAIITLCSSFIFLWLKSEDGYQMLNSV